jgi:hypothetical protein
MVSRIISLNLRHGGGRRIAPLTDWLLRKSPSAIIATEWRNNVPGQHLRNRLTLGGLPHMNADLIVEYPEEFHRLSKPFSREHCFDPTNGVVVD